MSLDKTILEMNKRINLAESMTEQMERRIKELEEETNSLGIIEPGDSDPLIVHVTKIKDFSILQEKNPDDAGFDLSITRLFIQKAEGSDDVDEWAIFKFPTIEKPPDVICLPIGGANFTGSLGNNPTFEIVVQLISDDFDIEEITWNEAQALNRIKYDSTKLKLDINIENTESGFAEHLTALRLCFENNLPSGNEDNDFTGILVRDGASSGTGLNSSFTVPFVTSRVEEGVANSIVGFYIPKKSF